MQKTIQNLIAKIYTSGNFMLSGALIFGVFQIPFVMPVTQESRVAKPEALETIAAEVSAPIAKEFFGKEIRDDVANSIIDQKAEFVSTRKAYPASLAVIQKHEKTIRAMARENGVPADVALGVGLLENGGSETAKSPAGALGVFQLMPGTARSLGLTVTKSVDERRIPEKNIDAGMRYLKSNHERFGNWGLATWAYHAGEGNVSKAVKIYAKANHNVTLAGVKDAKSMREYVEKHDITVHKLLSDASVKTFTKKLNDDSSGYPYKVMATAKLFKEEAKAKKHPTSPEASKGKGKAKEKPKAEAYILIDKS